MEKIYGPWAMIGACKVVNENRRRKNWGHGQGLGGAYLEIPPEKTVTALGPCVTPVIAPQPCVTASSRAAIVCNQLKPRRNNEEQPPSTPLGKPIKQVVAINFAQQGGAERFL